MDAFTHESQIPLVADAAPPAADVSLTILSFGGGQDSAAILGLLTHDEAFRQQYARGELMLVFSDTGDEHPHTYKYLDYVRTFCAERRIPFHAITKDLGFHKPSWPSLREAWARNDTIGSRAFPASCSGNLKTDVIYAYLDAWLNKRMGTSYPRKRAFREWAGRYGRIRVLLGISKGEEKRVLNVEADTRRWRRSSVDFIYPLIERGMDRLACQAYIRSIGMTVPYPSNCMLCPFLAERELVWLYRFHRQDYEEWVRLEARKLARFAHKGEKNFGVFGKLSLPEALTDALAKYGDMTDAELDAFKFSHGRCLPTRY